MSATLEWVGNLIGGAGDFAAFVPSNKIRFKTANDNNDDNNDPCIKSGGTTYSFEKMCGIRINTGSTYDELSNLVVSTAAPPTGMTLKYTSVAQASLPHAPVMGDAGVAGAGTEFPQSPTAWPGAAATVTGVTNALWTTAHALYLLLILNGPTVSGGEQTFTITARYDEIV